MDYDEALGAGMSVGVDERHQPISRIQTTVCETDVGAAAEISAEQMRDRRAIRSHARLSDPTRQAEPSAVFDAGRLTVKWIGLDHVVNKIATMIDNSEADDRPPQRFSSTVRHHAVAVDADCFLRGETEGYRDLLLAAAARAVGTPARDGGASEPDSALQVQHIVGLRWVRPGIATAAPVSPAESRRVPGVVAEAQR